MYGAILGDIIGKPYEFNKKLADEKKFPLFGKYSRYSDDKIIYRRYIEMYGAILGDIIGKPYEFNKKLADEKKFPLFGKYSRYSDDTVMTIAVGEAIVNTLGKSDDEVKEELVKCMQKWGQKYPNAGFGGKFRHWLVSANPEPYNPEPYNSFGDGSAMRVSSIAWIFNSLEDVLHYAKLSAEVTHNHPEGIKGAQAAASAVYLARTGKSKEEILDYIVKTFSYDLSKCSDDYKPMSRDEKNSSCMCAVPQAFVAFREGDSFESVIRKAISDEKNSSCMCAVPQAFVAFREGDSFESVIRKAISQGGDADTVAAIAGSIAEAYYGVPNSLKSRALTYLPKDLQLALVKQIIPKCCK